MRSPHGTCRVLKRSLLYGLLRADPFRNFDGNMVVRQIQSIASTLSTLTTRREAKLYLACELGADSRLSHAIVTASCGTIEAVDVERQLAFVREDLNDAPQIVQMKADDYSPKGRLLLVGQLLNYRLREFCLSDTQNRPGKWHIAMVSEISARVRRGRGGTGNFRYRNRGDVTTRRKPALRRAAGSYESMAATATGSDCS